MSQIYQPPNSSILQSNLTLNVITFSCSAIQVERDREMQTHANMRSDLKIKELTELISSQERVALKLDKEVSSSNC